MKSIPHYHSNPNFSDKFSKMGLGSGRVALGTAGIGGAWGPVNEIESIDTLLWAFESGIRIIDTAAAYNEAENYLGKAIKEWKGEQPIISTKVGKLKTTDATVSSFDFSKERMQKSVYDSLSLLNINQIDILFLHEAYQVPVQKRSEVIDAMLSFKDQKLAKYIGITGHWDDISWIVGAKCFDVVQQFNNLDAACLDGLQKDVPALLDANIAIYQGSALHMGLLGNRLQKFIENPDWMPQKHINSAIKVKKVAEAYEISLPTLAQRFMYSIAEIDRMVIGSRNLEQLKSTLNDIKQGKLEKEIFDKIIDCIEI